ncbi:hypothetical protein LPB72_09705 [Hydrogenophaga crassostreae]|jgi:hypothetical protein|uniref:Helix-turn-helix domain-containing protein n=1 Tax=Hydrogenophaga crassostreae TaxID=1763535 RepID=A0A167HQM5_9BURK|nr:hypothetical protein [Hydrogenophaga crassostreae]AOW13318.1 hypothetical protein LPB072_11090 [Hydrogenophaga crassostreae]OAD41599.1 hypothetical protein LPB72_09705 [Hydrogenophaga crassostreae]
MKTNSFLFVNLIYRLKSFRDVAVLMFLLEVDADQKEYACSASVLSQRYLGNQISARQVEKAIKDLCDLNLVSIRVHANTKTYFKVNRDKVLSLLNQPLPERMPGLDDLKFPFLDKWSGAGEMPQSESA